MSVSDPVYRDNTAVAQSRRDELQREYLAQLAQLDPRLVRIYKRRVARAVFGMIATLGGVAMFLLGLSDDAGRWFWFPPDGNGATLMLINTWVFAGVGYAIARWAGSHHALQVLAESAEATDDVFTDIARFEHLSPTERMVDLCRRAEYKSVGWPLVGLALIAPLSMHGVVAVLVSGFNCSLVDFDGWIRMSAILVGHCHLVLAYYGWRFARDAYKVPISARILERTQWQRAFWVIAWSLFPGGLFILPVGIAAVTGIVYILAIYGWTAYVIEHERDALYTSPDA